MDQRDNRNDSEAEPNKKLFVSGLDWNATDEDLKKAFEPFGEIVQASVVRFSDTGRSKGFGFVEYNTVEDATKAKEAMHGQNILERAIRVNFAFPKKPSDE